MQKRNDWKRNVIILNSYKRVDPRQAWQNIKDLANNLYDHHSNKIIKKLKNKKTGLLQKMIRKQRWFLKTISLPYRTTKKKPNSMTQYYLKCENINKKLTIN